MAYDKSGRERLGRLSQQMHDIVNLSKAQNRDLRDDEREKFERLEAAFKKQQEYTTALEGQDSDVRNAPAASFLDGAPGPRSIISGTQLEELQDTYRSSRHDRRQQTPHDKIFSKYLRGTEAALDSDELALLRNAGGSRFQNVTSTTTGSQGGYIVPTGFSGVLSEALKWFGGMDICGEILTETGQPLPYPTNDDTMNQGRIIGQNTQNVQTDPTFGQINFSAYIFSSDICLVPRALIEDSFFDLDSLIARMLGTRIGRLMNNKCTLGSGVGEPNGIIPAATTAGNVVTFPTGSTTTLAYNDIVNCHHAVDPSWRYNPSSRWMFSDSVLKILTKLVDGNNRPLWLPALSASFQIGAVPQMMSGPRPTVLGHEYILNQDMATPAANQYTVCFGDLNEYKIRKVGSIQVQRLTERFADFLQIGYIGWMRLDGQLLAPSSTASLSPIALGRQSAT